MSSLSCTECERSKSFGFYMQVYIILCITETYQYHNSVFFFCVAFTVDSSELLEITLVTLISFGFGEGGPISQETCVLLIAF